MAQPVKKSGTYQKPRSKTVKKKRKPSVSKIIKKNIEKDGDFYLLQKDRDTSKEILCRKNGVKLFYITKRNYNLEEILNYINNGAAE